MSYQAADSRYSQMPYRRCGASLARLGLDYVDIFYHHRPDNNTPLEETMAALDHLVRSGRALYVGLSNYGPERTCEAAALLRQLGTPCLIHQARYNLLDRMAQSCGQTLAQMALAWVLRHAGMTSVLIGASRSSQIDDAVQALRAPDFTAAELAALDTAAIKAAKPGSGGINALSSLFGMDAKTVGIAP